MTGGTTRIPKNEYLAVSGAHDNTARRTGVGGVGPMPADVWLARFICVKS